MPVSDAVKYVKKTFENKWGNVLSFWSKHTLLVFSFHCTVVDPDLQTRVGGGPSHPDPEIRGDGLQNNFFLALQASFLSKNKEGAPPPGPSPGSAPLHVRRWVCYPSSFIEGVCNEYLLIKIDMQRGDRSRLSTSARRVPVQDFQWMNFAFMPWQGGWSLDRFHMTSRRPLLVTVKWRPCMCS